MSVKNSAPGSKLNSIVTCKCPKCRSGKVFKYPVYNLSKFFEAYENCPVCNYKFETETGFYWAAMYISYGFSAGLMLVLGLIAINFNLPFTYIYFIIFPLVIIISPFSFRYSRMLLLHLFSRVTFDPEAWKNKDPETALEKQEE